MDINKIYKLYEKMIAIRLIEEKIIDEYPSQQIRTPVHLYIGQEAVASGVSINLKDSDCIVSNHRSHGHCIAKGLNVEGFFKELYGKEGGVTKGFGGSTHLVDSSKGIIGTSAIVAGGIPIAAGVALKQKLKNEQNITVVYFGDGAVDEGVFWETINFSALMKLPILFVMEDNCFASQTHKNVRHSYDDITNIVEGFSVETFKVNGNDVINVAEISQRIIKDIRQGSGPKFMYCATYRWMGHVGPKDDTDTGYRTKEERDYWKLKCPIKSIEEYIKENDKENAEDKISDIKVVWNKKIKEAVLSAKEAKYAVD